MYYIYCISGSYCGQNHTPRDLKIEVYLLVLSKGPDLKCCSFVGSIFRSFSAVQ